MHEGHVQCPCKQKCLRHRFCVFVVKHFSLWRHTNMAFAGTYSAFVLFCFYSSTVCRRQKLVSVFEVHFSFLFLVNYFWCVTLTNLAFLCTQSSFFSFSIERHLYITQTKIIPSQVPEEYIAFGIFFEVYCCGHIFFPLFNKHEQGSFIGIYLLLLSPLFFPFFDATGTNKKASFPCSLMFLNVWISEFLTHSSHNKARF